MAIDGSRRSTGSDVPAAGRPGSHGGRGGRRGGLSRYLPGWARFTLALWIVCLLLLGFQHLSLLAFTLSTGG